MTKLFESIANKKKVVLFGLIYFVIATSTHQIALYHESGLGVRQLPIDKILFSSDFSKAIFDVVQFKISFLTICYSGLVALISIWSNEFIFKLLSFLSAKALILNVSEYQHKSFIDNSDALKRFNFERQQVAIRQLININSLALSLCLLVISNSTSIFDSYVTIPVVLIYIFIYLLLLILVIRYFLPSLVKEQGNISDHRVLYNYLKDIVS